MEIQKPKGTYDLYGEEARKVQYIEKLLFDTANKYNYTYVRTPLFEYSELFHRGVGETTDIVSKETYDFIDRGDRHLTLRPEGTAGVVRALIENKIYGDPSQPVKLYYYGPMYRYERPQSGRYREFYQFGVEAFGSDDPMIDAEVISMAVSIYRSIGLKNVKVKLNTLGDIEGRLTYRGALKTYFKPYLSELCEDCQKRYENNPLRILDCKIDADKEIMKKAPKITNFLTGDAVKYFNEVKKYLEALDIKYEVNESLVRGLDYYNHTIFEIEADIKGFGSQNVLGGGGRYNNLVEILGGPSTPSIGFAIGIERLMSAIDAEKINILDDNNLNAFILYLTDKEKEEAFKLLQELRDNNLKADMDYMNRNLKGQFKQADRLNSNYLIIIGEEEVKKHEYVVKNNKTKEEKKVNRDRIIDFFINIKE